MCDFRRERRLPNFSTWHRERRLLDDFEHIGNDRFDLLDAGASAAACRVTESTSLSGYASNGPTVKDLKTLQVAKSVRIVGTQRHWKYKYTSMHKINSTIRFSNFVNTKYT